MSENDIDTVPTPMHHLLDCKNCGDEFGYPHQKMHHSDKDGHCMLGESMGKPCQCIGFEVKEADDISHHEG